ncbi:MAG: M23 family metallopeptidase [Clostridiales bacterium]|nr:M23 family metallopeptidase [Clostridiales bacterium]
MNRQTEVKSMRLKREGTLISDEGIPGNAVLSELPLKKSIGRRIIQADRLIRNLAVVGALALTVVAVKNAGAPQAQSVFSAIQQSAGMEWDESLGKLSFVGGFLPEGIQAVWSEKEALTVFAPVMGETVHAWTRSEPYVEYAGTVADVRAVADGEVMSIAHGLDEERILRIRHDDETESIYGNLQNCYAQVGDRVYAGDVVARTLDGKPLAFELRKDGRSINPEGLLLPLQD